MVYTIALWLLVWAAPSSAQGAPNASLGYVVRLVDAKTVVLDFNEKSGATPGESFVLFKEGADLKHPVSGSSLGKLEIPVAEGSLKEILPLYSLGTLSTTPTQPIKPGMRVRLKPVVATPQTPASANAPRAAQGKVPLWRGPVFDYQATSLAVADMKGTGGLQTAISDGHNVFLYPYPPVDAKPVVQFSHKGTSPRIASLEAADLNGNGRAEIFASLYNNAFSRFETIVLEIDAQGQLTQIADLPYLVRKYQDPSGAPRLAAQQVVEDRSFPFGTIYPLTFQDGKYHQAKPAVKFPKRQTDWLYDFTFATLDGKTADIFISNTELLGVQFEKGGSIKTAESYGQTPHRVRWTGDRLLYFRPPMLVRYDAKGLAGLYLIKNLAALGGLASPFGIFSRGELHHMEWNGLNFSTQWTAPLGGWATGLALVEGPGRSPELAVAVVSAAEKTSIWGFEP